MERIKKGQSLIKVVSDYIVIDLETTGYSPQYNEIIEFCGIKISKGQIIEKYSTLVKPRNTIDNFITELTGITNEMVDSAPYIEDCINDILAFIDDTIILGHNVNFDINFLYDNALEISGKAVTNDFIDLLRFTRKLFKDLENHKLGTIAAKLNKRYFPSHRAENDCLATFEAYEKTCEYIKSEDLDLNELFKRSWNGHVYSNVKNIICTKDNIDPDNPIYGLTVVFTGALAKMSRNEAWQLVANLGGIPADVVNKTTNLLVLGDKDYKDSASGKKSTKYLKAQHLILNNADLKIISETVFFNLIDEMSEKEIHISQSA